MRRRTFADFARQTGHTEIRLRNLARRFVVEATDAVAWLLEGFRDETGRAEPHRAEVFPGIGIVARPPEGGAPEAVVVSLGGEANNPAIVATRDRATERAVIEKAGLQPGETLVYTDTYQVKLSAEGVAVGKLGGPFRAVALDDHRHQIGPLVVQFPQTVAFVPGSPPMAVAVTAGVAPGATALTTESGDSNSQDTRVS